MTPVLTVVLVVVMLASAVMTGSAILRGLRTTPAPTDRLLFGVLLGLSVQATLLLALSALGWMHPLLLWSAVVLPGALAIRERDCFAAARRELGDLLASADPVERIVVSAVAVAVLTVLVVGALGPVMDWDSLMYHVQLPRLFLQEGRLFLPADGLHLAFLGSFQFLYLPLLALDAAPGAALLNAAMAMGLGLAVTMAGSRLLGRSAGLVAGVALWGSSSLFLVAMTPRVDVTLIFAVFLAHYALLLALRDEAAWGPIVVALTAGAAMGIKYHAIPYLAALVPFTLWALWRQDRALWLRRAGVCLVAALAVTAPWMIKNQWFFGAPLYPFFAERVMPPFIAEYQGSRAHPEGVPISVHSALSRVREPISLTALLFRPAALTVEGEANAFTRNPVLFLAPLALLFLRDRTVLALTIPVVFYLGITLGYFSRTNLRYLMPIIPPMVLLAAEAVRRLGARLPSAVTVGRITIALAALATLPALRVAGARALTPLRVEIALGLEPPEALLNGDVQFVVARWIAENTPPDAKLLMLFDARGFYHERAVIQDNILANWALLVGTGATDQCLAGTGITHVFVNRALLAYYQTRGLDPASLYFDRFPAFVSRCLEPLVTTNSVEIYRVR